MRMKSLSNDGAGNRCLGYAWRDQSGEILWLGAAVADCRRIVAANLGGERIYREAALARKPLGFCYRLKGREHQEFSISAGSEVISARFKIRTEASRNYRDKRERRFAYGLRDRLLTRRNAARYRNSAALSVENRFFNNCRDFAFARSSRNLDKHFVGRIQKKVISYGITPFIIRERDRARHFEKFGVLHDSPTSFNIIVNVGRHYFKLTFGKENCIVKPREPESRRFVKERRLFKRGVSLSTSDFKTTNDFAERGIKALMNPDNAVEMLRHYYALARLDFREERADISPSFGDFRAKLRGNHFTVDDFTENGAALFNRKRNHINPWLAIIPAREANSRFKMTVFIAAVVHGSIIAKKGRLAQRLRQAGPGAGSRRSGSAWRDPVQPSAVSALKI